MVEACRRLLAALDERDAAIIARDLATRAWVRELADAGSNVEAAVGDIRERLAAVFSAQDMRRLGVSRPNLRLAVERPRTPPPT